MPLDQVLQLNMKGNVSRERRGRTAVVGFTDKDKLFPTPPSANSPLEKRVLVKPEDRGLAKTPDLEQAAEPVRNMVNGRGGGLGPVLAPKKYCVWDEWLLRETLTPTDKLVVLFVDVRWMGLDLPSQSVHLVLCLAVIPCIIRCRSCHPVTARSRCSGSRIFAGSEECVLLDSQRVSPDCMACWPACSASPCDSVSSSTWPCKHVPPLSDRAWESFIHSRP